MKKLLIEPILPIEEAAQMATAEERMQAQTYAPSRGREYLAWRAIVRRELGTDTPIAYNRLGAPVLPGSPLHISVSHCRDRVAVAISENPCAVDIERIDRNFGRVLPRYLSETEQRLSTVAHFPAVAWCIKECLYKYAAQTEIDWLRDLRIERIENIEGIDGITADNTKPRTTGKAQCLIADRSELVEVSFCVECHTDDAHAWAWIL